MTSRLDLPRVKPADQDYPPRVLSGREVWHGEPRIDARLADVHPAIGCLVARGMTNKGVAHRLHITEATVKSHLLRIFAKLDIADLQKAYDG